MRGLCLLAMFALACVAKIIPYSAKIDLALPEAQGIVEETLRTQHRIYAPDYVRFGKEYVSFGGGYQAVIRLRYTEIERTLLIKYHRRLMKHYGVQVVLKNRAGRKWLLRSSSEEDAKRLIDAFKIVIAAHSAKDQEGAQQRQSETTEAAQSGAGTHGLLGWPRFAANQLRPGRGRDDEFRSPLQSS